MRKKYETRENNNKEGKGKKRMKKNYRKEKGRKTDREMKNIGKKRIKIKTMQK